MLNRWDKRLKKRGFKLPDVVTGYAFVTPVLLWVAVFMVYPLYYIIFLSFFDWNLMDVNKKFTGLDNFTRMFQDSEFTQSIWNTFHFIIGKVTLSVAAALLIAILLNQKLRGIKTLRAFFYSPVVVSMVAAAMIWNYLYDPSFGPLTSFFQSIGLTSPRWLDDPAWAMNSIILMSTWKNMGYYAVIYLAGLQSISDDFYEAASIDGATGLRKFYHITWPLLMPATMLVVIMSMIHAFQVFAQVYVMTAGGPVGSTNVIVYYLYKVAFEYFEIGYASAVGLFLFIVMLIFTLLQYRIMNSRMDH